MFKNKYLLSIEIFIVFFLLCNLNGLSKEFLANTQSNQTRFGAGIEYAKNSEIGVLGQFNYKKLGITGQVRWCTHSKKIYFTPGVKYYFDKKFIGIQPFINARYGKLHYNQKWSKTGYEYNVVYVWDAAMGQMMPMVQPSSSSQSGYSFINTPAFSLSGGGSYSIKNFGIEAALGMSNYLKIEGDFKNKNKFFFSLAALYYFGKK